MKTIKYLFRYLVLVIISGGLLCCEEGDPHSDGGIDSSKLSPAVRAKGTPNGTICTRKIYYVSGTECSPHEEHILTGAFKLNGS